MSHVAVLFNVHPWEFLTMDSTERTWYQEVSIRHLERQTQRDQALLDALAKMLGVKRA
jgi:hypothetical protein